MRSWTQWPLIVVCILLVVPSSVVVAQSATVSHKPLRPPTGGLLPGRVPHDLLTPELQRYLERNGLNRGSDPENRIRQLQQLTGELTRQLSGNQQSQPDVRKDDGSSTTAELDSLGGEFPPTTIPTDQWLPFLEQFIPSDVVESLKRAVGPRSDNPRATPSQPAADRSSRSAPTTNRRGTTGGGNSRNSSSRAQAVRPNHRPAANSATSNTPSRSTGSKRGQGWSGVSQQILVESFIEALDAVGTDWMQTPRNARGPTRDSWWQALHQRASGKIRSWNQSVNRRSREVSRRLASVDMETAAPVIGGSAELNDTWPEFAAVVLIITALVGCWCWNGAKGSTRPTDDRVLPPTKVSVITDRDSLLRACHQLAIRHFGMRSCFWNHRQIFAALTSTLVEHADNIQQLSLIYERARYSSAGRNLSASQLQRAIELFGPLWHTSPR